LKQEAHSWSVVLAILGCDENEKKGKEVEKNPETNNKVLEELPRDYLALEAFSSFVASFLFLRGYTLDYDRTNRLAVFTHYGSVPLGLIFLALSFFFFIATYTGRLYGIGKRARKFLPVRHNFIGGNSSNLTSRNKSTCAWKHLV
jgi:hypothetical protein